MAQKRILIVDDDEFNQEVLEMRLDVFELESIILNNGQEALDFIKSSDSIDLIFMDINMPLLDGDKATELIREYEKLNNLKRVPIIAAGASIDEKDRERLFLSGMDEMIIKPITQKSLEVVLEKFLFTTKIFEYDIKKASQTLAISPEMMQDFLSKFVLSLDNELIEMMGMAQKEDFKALAGLAHKLKGRSGNLQVMEMYEIFSSIEKGAKERKKLDYEKLIDEIFVFNDLLKKL